QYGDVPISSPATNPCSFPAGSGSPGPRGPRGNSVLSGSGAPAMDLGKVGDYYIDFVAWKIYGPKTETGWGMATSLVGPQGAQGGQGPRGPAGKIPTRLASGTSKIERVRCRAKEAVRSPKGRWCFYLVSETRVREQAESIPVPRQLVHFARRGA